jgi:hypothetical protein
MPIHTVRHDAPRRAARLAMLIVVIASACGSDSDRADTVPAAASAPPTSGDSAAETQPDSAEAVASTAESEPAVQTTLQAAIEEPDSNGRDPAEIIITLDDMPTGWSPSAEDDEEEDSGEGGSCLDSVFNSSSDLFASNSDVPTAEASFSQSDFGPFLGAAVATEVEQADELFEGLAERFAACDGTTDDQGYTYAVLPVSFPALGDDTFATRIDGEGNGSFPISMMLVLARVDDVVIFTFGAAVMGAYDAALVEQATRTMVDRV